VSEEVEVQRAALLARRAALTADGNTLRESTQRLAGSVDLAALQTHSERLQRHRQAVEDFGVLLEAFHHQFGPLDIAACASDPRLV